MGFEVAGGDGGELFFEVVEGHFFAVGGGEDGAVFLEAIEGEGEEVVVVFFDAEDFAFLIAGKGGRVEDDGVKFATLFCEAIQPVEGVAFAKIMVGGVEVVEGEVFACPIEVRLGKVEGGSGGSGGGGADGESSSVGEGVEEGLAGRRS